MKTTVIHAAVLVAVLAAGVSGLSAAPRDERPAEWPEFHGPKRDRISTETGLLKQWPEGGPRLVWQYDACGTGYSGVAIAEGMIFTAGDFEDGEQEWLLALDLEGKLLWKTPNGKAWLGPTPGSRTTPTYSEGVLYHMNPTGRIIACQAKTGRPIWSVDLKERFDARWGTWALAENLIVDGDRVLCLPGGTKATAAALDKRTGKTLWVNTEIDDRAAYCSPVVGTWHGVRQWINMTARAAVSIDVATGKLLWSHPHGRVWQNTTTPIFHEGHVFITCGHSSGGTLLKIHPDNRGVTQVWHRKDLDNCHGGVILLDGRLYGCGCRLGGKSFFCVDFLTGKTIQEDKTLGKVSIAYADGMLYALNHKGPMSLVAITPKGFRTVSQFRMPRGGKGLYLCHPVICGGRLYLRHDEHLYAYDVRAK